MCIFRGPLKRLWYVPHDFSTKIIWLGSTEHGFIRILKYQRMQSIRPEAMIMSSTCTGGNFAGICLHVDIVQNVQLCVVCENSNVSQQFVA